MAKIFNDLVYGQYVPQYVGLPLDRAESVADTLDTRYRANKEAQDQLEIMIDNLDVRDVNRPYLQQALGNAQNRLKGIREQGNWEHSGLLVKQAAKEFAMDKNVQGSLKDKASYDAYMKDLDERFKEDKIDPNTYMNAKKLATIQNQSPVEYNPVTGEYNNIWSAYSPMNYQDIQKATFEMGEKWKSSTTPFIAQYQDKTGKIRNERVIYDPKLKGYKIVGSNEYLSEAELQSGLRQAVLANPQYKGFIQEGLMFNKALKRNEDGSQRTIEVRDLFSANPDDGALFSLDEEKARDAIESLGYDYDKMMADEDYREALYDLLYMNKEVDNYVNPAASAYSFQNITEKYLTDHVLLKAIDHANKLAQMKFNRNTQFELQRRKQTFEKQQNNSIIVSNASAVMPGKDYNIQKEKEAIKQTESELASISRQIAANKSEEKGNLNELRQRQKQLQGRLRAQKNSYSGKVKYYLQSPLGQGWIDKQWKAFNKKYPEGTSLHMSRSEFEKHIKQKDLDTEQYEREQTIPSIGASEVGASPKRIRTREGKRNAYINSLSDQMENNITSYIQENGVQGVFGNVITGNDKSYVGKLSKTLTNFVDQNRTNFETVEGVQLDQLIEEVTDEVGKNGIEIAVAPIDNTTDDFYYNLTITDKKTGTTKRQVAIYPKSGSNDVYYNLGINGMQETDPNTEQHKMFKHMAAKATFNAWQNNQFDDQTASVTEYDPSGTSATSELFTAGNDAQTGQPLHWKVRKERRTFYDEEGMPIGTNTVYQLQQYKQQSDGSYQYAGNMPNLRYTNDIQQVNSILDDENNLSPQEREIYLNRKMDYESFNSQDDAKVQLFELLYPNAGQVQYTPTSETTTEIKRTSTTTKK